MLPCHTKSSHAIHDMPSQVMPFMTCQVKSCYAWHAKSSHLRLEGDEHVVAVAAHGRNVLLRLQRSDDRVLEGGGQVHLPRHQHATSSACHVILVPRHQQARNVVEGGGQVYGQHADEGERETGRDGARWREMARDGAR
jgi:hypothetical protein